MSADIPISEENAKVDAGRVKAVSMGRTIQVLSAAMREYAWLYLQQAANKRAVECESVSTGEYWRMSMPYFRALADVAEAMAMGPGALKFLRRLEDKANVGDKTIEG